MNEWLTSKKECGCLTVQHAPRRCRECGAEEQAADCAGHSWSVCSHILSFEESVVCFFDLLDIAALIALIIWIMNDPTWTGRKKYRRWLFLKQLARSLVTPWITVRANEPVTTGAPCNSGSEIWDQCLRKLLAQSYLCDKKKDRITQYISVEMQWLTQDSVLVSLFYSDPVSEWVVS